MAYARKRGKYYSARWRTKHQEQSERGGFLTRKEAEQFAQEQEALERKGKNTKPSQINMTLREFVSDVWAPTLEVEDQTRTDYENAYNCHIDPEFGHLQMSAILPSDIKKWRVRMANSVANTGRKVNQSYIEKLTNQLGQILRSAVENDFLDKSPMTKVRRKKLKKKNQVVPWDFGVVEQIANAFAPRWRILIWIGFFTGMRPSEILGLTWDQFDFENEIIDIDRQLSRDTNKTWADHLKTPKSYRKIPFAKGLQKLLLEHKDKFGVGPHNLVLQNRSGNVWRYHDASAMFRDIVRPMGMDKGEGLHQLRHTFASTLIKLNVNAKQIQELLGHESILETMDTYGHLFPGDLQGVCARLDEYAKSAVSAKSEMKMLA